VRQNFKRAAAADKQSKAAMESVMQQHKPHAAYDGTGALLSVDTRPLFFNGTTSVSSQLKSVSSTALSLITDCKVKDLPYFFACNHIL
jgi:hypothetical protein